MLVRALIVLLVFLNLGVAAWWMTRADDSPSSAFEPLAGVPILRLPSEVPLAQRAAAAVMAPVSAAVSAPDPPAPADPATTAPPPVASAPLADAAPPAEPPTPVERCFAIGPFADAAAVAQARGRLQGQTLRLSERSVAASTTRGWRVWLPPLADRPAAVAMAERIKAAGFSDLFVLAAGDDGNGIALGRFGSEASARRRESDLRAAGFNDVRAEAIGGTAGAITLDVAVAPPGSAGTLRQLTGAATASTIDCATLR